jgi:hypothetical protein
MSRAAQLGRWATTTADASHASPATPAVRPWAAVAARWWRSSIAAVASLSCVLLLQWTGGAYQAEFGGHPDEAAHYVTGLMIHDYVAAGLPGNPMTFALDYYDHYPKVALGNWPPLFYVLQAGWALLFTPDRASILLLMAVLAALVAFFTTRALVEEFGWPLALFGGLLFLTFPLVQQHAAMVMTEMAVALFTLLATIQFGRYLDRGATRDSVLFGLFASAAILTKGSGLALALVPVIAILVTGRFGLLAQRNFWYPVPIVAVLSGPWTWAFRRTAQAGWQSKGISFGYMEQAVVQFPTALFTAASLVITLFAGIGFVTMLVAVRRGTVPRHWAAPLALVVSVLLFHMIVPASLDRRHLIPALSAWAMFGVAGIAATVRVAATSHPQLRWVAYTLAMLGLLHTAAQAPGKHAAGFARVVEDVVARHDDASGLFLVSSDATGEGMFIAETAMADHRPQHVIRRASKLLSTQAWDGSGYQAKVDGPAELIALLRQERVRFIVIDETVPASLLAPHHALLRATAASSPGQFTLRGTYPMTRDYLAARPGEPIQDGIRLYELRDGP